MQSFNDFCKDNNIKLETTSNFDLINYIKQLKIKNFRGYFMKDELPKKIKSKESAIANLQNSNQPGTHHTAYWKNNKDKYYFDSYGLDPSNQMLKYLKSPLVISTYQIQNSGTVICGQLCIYMLYMLDHNHKFIDILLSLMNEFHSGSGINEDISTIINGYCIKKYV